MDYEILIINIIIKWISVSYLLRDIFTWFSVLKCDTTKNMNTSNQIFKHLANLVILWYFCVQNCVFFQRFIRKRQVLWQTGWTKYGDDLGHRFPHSHGVVLLLYLKNIFNHCILYIGDGHYRMYCLFPCICFWMRKQSHWKEEVISHRK